MESLPTESGAKRNFVYEEEALENKQDVAAFLPEIICGICNSILRDPLECKICEKPICQDCKSQWFCQNPNHCPFCRSYS